MSTPPGLGPHCVGQRVVVRRVVRGETGPTGGPAFTDLLGVMESWSSDATSVRDESGTVTVIALADIVSGKPVPPRPSPRHRVSAEEAERRANASWPALETQPLGDWLLRASGGFSDRANSVMAVGDPGVPSATAVADVVGFYRDRGLPPLAQVVVESDPHRAFDATGWVSARPGEADTEFQIASVAAAQRRLRGSADVVTPVWLETRAGAAWLADDRRARSHADQAIRVLEGPGEVVFASVEDPVVAKGRAAFRDDWLGITDVWVSPSHRRKGLAAAVLRALLGWGAERGATTAYVQTRGDNPAALALYERFGFRTHHTYRYLRPPSP